MCFGNTAFERIDCRLHFSVRLELYFPTGKLHGTMAG